jgi:hypothetical protein
MSGTNTRFRREEKRAAAEKRQVEYDKLTIAEKLAKLDMGSFTATKQRARLNG